MSVFNNIFTGNVFLPKLEIIAEDENLMPFYAHPGDAGMDLRSSEDVTVRLGQIKPIDTGIKVAIPDGYVGLVNPRSSLGGQGITVANSPGTVDSGYRGPLKVLLVNHSEYGADFEVKRGDRIAQLLIVPVATARIQRVTEFSDADTSRGEGGFGSTGTN